MGLHVGEVLIPQNYKSYLTSKKDALECFLEKFIRLIIQSITTHVQGLLPMQNIKLTKTIL